MHRCSLMASNITIVLIGQVNVSESVLFKNISNLSILSENSKLRPTLDCSGFKSRNSLPGFQFVEVSSLYISDVKIVGCGAEHIFVNGIATAAAMVITNCSDVFLANIDISQSNNATSLLIENTSGNVTLEKLVVRRNNLPKLSVKAGLSFARGVFIYVNSSSVTGHYSITSCVFEYITTPRYKNYDADKVRDTANWLGYGLGGGLTVIFDDNSSNNEVLLENCTFQHNCAPWGAGMYLGFRKHSSSNFVNVTHSSFRNCTAGITGGGLEVGCTKESLNPNNNPVFVINSMFKDNSAIHGAGTRVVALPSLLLPERGDFVTFHNCSWIENKAIYSPAVDVSPAQFDQLGFGTLPIPVFRDCTFIRNTIKFKEKNITKYITSGVFVITRFTVSFVGKFSFISNYYTALQMNSGKVTLEENTQLRFVNNTGFQGGAVALHGFSYISVSDNCRVEFINNRATEYGGAIFYSPIEQREFFEGRICFLMYSGKSPLNNSFVFTENSALVSGSSIYSTSLHACYFTYRGTLKNHKVYEFFKDIGNFTFDGMTDNDIVSAALGTAGRRFKSTGKQSITSSPGMKLSLPLSVIDELNQEVKFDFFAHLHSNTSIHLNSPYTVNRSVVLYGAPSDGAELVISTLHTYRSIQCTLDVTLSACPPGYFHYNSTCSCSAYKKDKAYIGIVKCNQNSTAVIRRGYWAGYYDNNRSELFTAPCPFHFCVHNKLTFSEHSLPNSPAALSSYMCGTTRQGVLCGQCRDGYSTYYHTKAFSCGTNDKCSYGAIFFILSDLLPVFILFTVIIVFDIGFSSGSRNGFVFFSQMVTILPLDYMADSQHHVVRYLQNGYNLIYGIFNIEFFSMESLSFCLFKNATVMDVLAFRYITVAFAFVLVLILTVCMNKCICCDKFCNKMKKKVTTKVSVLQGLSAFLVICYVESVRVSFFILRLKILRGVGGNRGPLVTFYGGESYFEGKHMFYAIPAILTLATIALFLPILLLLYPTVLKVLQLCKISEHRLVLATLKFTRINSLMPWLDVFQGHFKDNCRFFAGLYFLYRGALLVPYSFCRNNSEYAIIGELNIILMLSFHSVAHPYQQKKHNILDSLLFTNLAIINGLSVVMFIISQDTTTSEHMKYVIIYFQLLLIYLPIVLAIVKLCNNVRQKFKQSKSVSHDEEELMSYLEYINESRDSDDLIQETH